MEQDNNPCIIELSLTGLSLPVSEIDNIKVETLSLKITTPGIDLAAAIERLAELADLEKRKAQN